MQGPPGKGGRGAPVQPGHRPIGPAEPAAPGGLRCGTARQQRLPEKLAHKFHFGGMPCRAVVLVDVGTLPPPARPPEPAGVGGYHRSPATRGGAGGDSRAAAVGAAAGRVLRELERRSGGPENLRWGFRVTDLGRRPRAVDQDVEAAFRAFRAGGAPPPAPPGGQRRDGRRGSKVGAGPGGPADRWGNLEGGVHREMFASADGAFGPFCELVRHLARRRGLDPEGGAPFSKLLRTLHSVLTGFNWRSCTGGHRERGWVICFSPLPSTVEGLQAWRGAAGQTREDRDREAGLHSLAGALEGVARAAQSLAGALRRCNVCLVCVDTSEAQEWTPVKAGLMQALGEAQYLPLRALTHLATELPVHQLLDLAADGTAGAGPPAPRPPGGAVELAWDDGPRPGHLRAEVLCLMRAEEVKISWKRRAVRTGALLCRGPCGPARDLLALAAWAKCALVLADATGPDWGPGDVRDSRAGNQGLFLVEPVVDLGAFSRVHALAGESARDLLQCLAMGGTGEASAKRPRGGAGAARPPAQPQCACSDAAAGCRAKLVAPPRVRECCIRKARGGVSVPLGKFPEPGDLERAQPKAREGLEEALRGARRRVDARSEVAVALERRLAPVVEFTSGSPEGFPKLQFENRKMPFPGVAERAGASPPGRGAAWTREVLCGEYGKMLVESGKDFDARSTATQLIEHVRHQWAGGGAEPSLAEALEGQLLEAPQALKTKYAGLDRKDKDAKLRQTNEYILQIALRFEIPASGAGTCDPLPHERMAELFELAGKVLFAAVPVPGHKANLRSFYENVLVPAYASTMPETLWALGKKYDYGGTEDGDSEGDFGRPGLEPSTVANDPPSQIRAPDAPSSLAGSQLAQAQRVDPRPNDAYGRSFAGGAAARARRGNVESYKGTRFGSKAGSLARQVSVRVRGSQQKPLLVAEKGERNARRAPSVIPESAVKRKRRNFLVIGETPLKAPKWMDR